MKSDLILCAVRFSWKLYLKTEKLCIMIEKLCLETECLHEPEQEDVRELI